MGDRSSTISKLKSDFEMRSAYIKAKLSTIVPSQIRALRLKSEMPRQADLAREAKMQQSRISMFETPGAANLTLETLSRIAAAFKVGVVVKFVPFSEMLAWENGFSQDQFYVVKIDNDTRFLNPAPLPSLFGTANPSGPVNYATGALAATLIASPRNAVAVVSETSAADTPVPTGTPLLAQAVSH